MVKKTGKKAIKKKAIQTRKRKQGTRKQGIRKTVYTEQHYNSRDGMLTYIWGPPLWHFLHTMSFNYPLRPTAQQKRDYRRFMESLQGVLPCGKCRENLAKNYRTLPLLPKHLEGREAFSRYVYELHEVVNRMLQKESGLTYDAVRDRYEHFRARCRQDKEGEIAKEQIAKEQIAKDGNDADKGASLYKSGDSDKKENKDKNKERGCVEPVYGVKSKCVLNIVPLDEPCKTLNVDSRCEQQVGH